jgi:KDO2-lipid IV(A) lauroyltransferase
VKKLLQKITSYIGIGFLYLISLLPRWVLYGISDVLYLLIYRIFGYRTKVVFGNLKRAFPQKNDQELKQIEKDFYRNLFDIMVETVKEFTISERSMRKHFKFVNPEVFQQHYDNNRSVMMMMGHYCNWEYGVSTPLWVPQDCWAVYGKLNNPFMDKAIVRVREKFNHKLFDMHATYDVMLSHEQGKKLYMFMADQSPHKGSVKHWVDFLGQDTPVHIGAEKLSMMMNMAVVFIDIQRVKRGYYEVTAKTLFDKAETTQQFEITNTYFQVLEEVIQKNPANWLWSHKRWKYSRADVAEAMAKKNKA